MNQLKRLLAFVLSFRKRAWSARDYPLRYRRQQGDPIRIRGELIYPDPWLVQIPGWWTMSGTGATREEALAALQNALDSYREAHDGSLPRPGTSVPIEFAPVKRMSRNEDLAREFFPPILGFDFDDCLITDESSVWDFPVEYSEPDLATKVLLVFGTDIGDLAERGNIAAILDRIADQRRRS